MTKRTDANREEFEIAMQYWRLVISKAFESKPESVSDGILLLSANAAIVEHLVDIAGLDVAAAQQERTAAGLRDLISRGVGLQ